MSVTVRQRWPFIQHTGGHRAVNKGSRGKKKKERKKETDPISSLREHDRGIKAILKFNGPCRFPSTCNLSQAARSIHWKEPVLELHHCYHCICYNAVLLEEALQPAHVCVCVSFFIFVDQSRTLKSNSTLNLVIDDKHCSADLCGLKGSNLFVLEITPGCDVVSHLCATWAAVLHRMWTKHSFITKWWEQQDLMWSWWYSTFLSTNPQKKTKTRELILLISIVCKAWYILFICSTSKKGFEPVTFSTRGSTNKSSKYVVWPRDSRTTHFLTE